MSEPCNHVGFGVLGQKVGNLHLVELLPNQRDNSKMRGGVEAVGALWTLGGLGECVIRGLCMSHLVLYFIIFKKRSWPRPQDSSFNQCRALKGKSDSWCGHSPRPNLF